MDAQTTPLKEALLRHRDETVYPLRKAISRSRLKYQFLDTVDSPRVSTQTLVIRDADPTVSSNLTHQIRNVLGLRGFLPSAAKSSLEQTWARFVEEPGFGIRITVSLHRSYTDDMALVLNQVVIQTTTA